MKLPARFGMLFTIATFVLSACALTSRSDPFSSGGSSASGNRPAVRVTLEVVCNQCLIRYSIGGAAGSARPTVGNQVWSIRLVRYPISFETIQLTATSAEDVVRSARIFVMGSWRRQTTMR